MPPDRVEDDVVVSLQYKLWLEDGSLVEESEADDPLEYLHGHRNIIPGLERELAGLRVGDEKTVVVQPEDAYGEYDPENVGTISRSNLPPDFDVAEGMMLEVVDEDGEPFIARVAEVSEDAVTLDYNHPMAGQQLRFEVEITGLREATSVELAHGHVHDPGSHHH